MVPMAGVIKGLLAFICPPFVCLLLRYEEN